MIRYAKGYINDAPTGVWRADFDAKAEEWTPGHNRINDGYSFKDMQESFHRNFAVVWEKLTRDSYTVVLQSGRHDFDVYYYKKIRFISLKKSRLLPSGPAVNKIGGGIVAVERQKELEQQTNQQRILGRSVRGQWQWIDDLAGRSAREEF